MLVVGMSSYPHLVVLDMRCLLIVMGSSLKLVTVTGLFRKFKEDMQNPTG